MSRCFAVLLLVSLPLAAETLSFSPEHPIASLMPGPPAVAQDDPKVASNGEGFLVAWTQWSHGDDVYATRVNAFGEVLDPSGIPVAILGADERLLDVFADGRGYLVVFRTVQGVSYVAIDEEGAVSPATLLVPEFLAFGVVGWDGQEFVIVESYGGEIVTRHVGRDGILLSQTVTSGPDAFVWDVIGLPGGAIAVMSDTRTYEYVLASVDGHAPPVFRRLGGGDVGAPRLSVSARSILVAGRASDGTLRAFLTDVESYEVVELSLPVASLVDYPLGTVGYDGGHRVYTIIEKELRLHEISDDGAVAFQTDPLQLVDGRLWATATDGASDLLVFLPPLPVSGWEPVVRGVLVRDGRAELVLGGEALTRTASAQEAPIITGGVALWSERRSVLAETTQWSAAIDGAGVASTAIAVSKSCRAASFDGHHRVALCVNDSEHALGLHRVSAEGVVESLPYATIAIAAGSDELQIVCGDGSCLTGWVEGVVVELALVSSSGALVSRLSTPQVAGLGRGVRGIELAYHDGVYLVVWSQIMNVTAPPFWLEPLDLYGVRVDGRGALVDLEPFVVASSEEDERDAEAAGGEGGFVVVWSRGSTIHGSRISVDSLPVEPETSPLAEGRFPSIVRHRSSFLVAWEAGNPHAGAESSDIGLGVIAGSSQLHLHGQVIAAGGAGNEFRPVLATGSDHALLLYHRVAHEAGIGGVTRIFARTVQLSARMRPTRR